MTDRSLTSVRATQRHAVIELLNRRSGSGFTAEDAATVRAWEHQLRGLL